MPTVADIFRQSAQLNRDDPRRQGNVVLLPSESEIVISGDIHGHRGNLAKVLDYADLPRHPQRILVLQELIHGQMDPKTGLDRSIELLMRAARLKLTCPNLLFVMGNHDLAQVTGNEITKEGRGVCKAFTQGLAEAFGPLAAEVSTAVNEFLLSLPLAVRAGDSLLVTHSLPSPARMSVAGVDILSAAGYTDAAIRRGGGAYEWTWGRGQTAEQLAELSTKTGAAFFVMGHRHSGTGFELVPDRAISIACDNDRAHILHLPPDVKLTIQNVQSYLKPVAAIDKT